jgi:hypothetical protein
MYNASAGNGVNHGVVLLCFAPAAGTSTPPGVASQLAKAAVAASYSDDAAAAAAAAASRNTFAAWAERVAQDPQAAAQRVSKVLCWLCRAGLCWAEFLEDALQADLSALLDRSCVHLPTRFLCA